MHRPYVGKYPITQSFNTPIGYIRGRKFHEALDIALPRRTALYAVADAVVVESSSNDGGWGESIVLSYRDYLGRLNLIRYAHLDERLVRLGDTVRQGQLIGYSGTTGFSTGYHLHLELTVNRKRTDPSFLLDYSTEVKKEVKMNFDTIIPGSIVKELYTKVRGREPQPSDPDYALATQDRPLSFILGLIDELKAQAPTGSYTPIDPNDFEIIIRSKGINFTKLYYKE